MASISELAYSLAEIKLIISASLPIDHSFIPFDILLAVVRGDKLGNDLTVKALFASLPYSDMGIRYHFRKLIKDGWIELHNGDKDTRVKRVSATEKLTKQFQILSTKLSPLITCPNSLIDTN